MTNHLNHLNLTKGKISKLYKKKKQTVKKRKNGKKNKRLGISHKKRKHFNLANKSLKKNQKGGGLLDWLTGSQEKPASDNQSVNNNNSSTGEAFNPLQQNPNLVSNTNQNVDVDVDDKKLKMDEVIKDLRNKLKRENKLQESYSEPSLNNFEDNHLESSENIKLPVYSQIPPDESEKSEIVPSTPPVQNVMDIPKEETEYSEIVPSTPPVQNMMDVPKEETEYSEIVPSTPVQNMMDVPKEETEYIEIVPSTPVQNVTDVPKEETEYSEIVPSTPVQNVMDVPKEETEYSEIVPSTQLPEDAKPETEYSEIVPSVQNPVQNVIDIPKEETEYSEIVPSTSAQNVMNVPKEETEYSEIVPSVQNPVPEETEYSEIVPSTPPVQNVMDVPKEETEYSEIVPSTPPILQESNNNNESISQITDSNFRTNESSTTLPVPISNSFQTIIDYLSNEIVGKISNVLGLSSSNQEKLQNGFIANNLNNRTMGMDSQEVYGGKSRKNHNRKKSKKYTRRNV